MVNRFFYRFLLGSFICAFALMGCQRLKQPEPTKAQFAFSPDWEQRKIDLAQATEWRTLGKLGVKTEQDGGSASLTWQQKSQDIHLEMVGPMGQGRLSITSSAGEFILTEAGKPPISATSAEALLLKTTGWRVPVAELSFWIRALPDPTHAIESSSANALGQLSELKQLGWQISYSDYLAVSLGNGKSQPMPSRIIAQYNRAPAIKLTLVVREWQLGSEKLGAQP